MTDPERWVRSFLETLSNPQGRRNAILAAIVGAAIAAFLHIGRRAFRYFLNPERQMNRLANAMDSAIRQFHSVQAVTVTLRSFFGKKITVTVTAQTLAQRIKEQTNKLLSLKEQQKLRNKAFRELQKATDKSKYVRVYSESEGKLTLWQTNWTDVLNVKSDRPRIIEPGDNISEGQIIAKVHTDDNHVVNITSPVNGWVMLLRRLKKVKKGDEIAVISRSEEQTEQRATSPSEVKT